MPTELTPQASKTSKELPPLTDDAKAAIVWMRGRAREAAEFAGVDDTAGDAIERLCTMEWGDDARAMFDSGGENQFEPDGSTGKLVPGENAEVQEPVLAMALRGGQRPTQATMMALCRSENPSERAAGEYLKRNPQHTAEGAPLSAVDHAYLQKLIAPKR